MSLITMVGDCTTTTCLALAATWVDDVVVLEADRSGGSLTAWLDTPATPSLSTIVSSSPVTRSTIDSMTQRSSSGIHFIASPIRARAATSAINEASTVVFPDLATSAHPVVLADVGRHVASDRPPAILGQANLTVICHRQESASASAETARLDRLVEIIESLDPLGVPLTLMIIGDDPFDPDEIAGLARDASSSSLVGEYFLPDDPLAAAVLAGRSGVSERRLRRLPLMRNASNVAAKLRSAVNGSDVGSLQAR